MGGWFISTNDPALTDAQKASDDANPLSAQIRAELLQEMGLTEGDISGMSAASQKTLNNDIADVVHDRLMESGQAQGAYVDTSA